MPSQAAAYALLERLRWGGPPTRCPHCDVDGRCYYLRPAQATERRVWKCASCRRQFSVLVGTVLQGTRIDLWTWIAVLDHWSACGPLTPAEVADRYELSAQSARHLVRRVAMAAGAEPARTCLARLRPEHRPTTVRPD